LKLLNKKSLIILGLNSGTSADGIDLAAVKIDRSNGKVSARFIKGSAKKFSPELRSKIMKLSESQSLIMEDIIDTDNRLGESFGRAAMSFLKSLEKEKIKIDVIASHGQTVRHLPAPAARAKKRSGTLQIGSLEMISNITGKLTVGDFRQADIALGNEGAPITVAAMKRLFAAKNESRLILNIGGISNFFYFPKLNSGLKVKARDCGPGNSLCDLLSQKLFNRKFDHNGKIANSGRSSKKILTLIMAEPFFKGKYVSTGKEMFGESLTSKMTALAAKFSVSDSDLLSTAAELTVLSMAHGLKPLIKKDKNIEKLYLTGGGRKNKFFVSRLKELLPETKIEMADKLGINADYIEAAAYAVMGEAALRSEPLPTLFTGKDQKQIAVLGKIVQPPVRI